MPPARESSKADHLAVAIRDAALSYGYADCGFAATDPFPDYAAAIDTRAALYPLAADTYQRLRSRADPRRSAPWARSIVVCIRAYGQYRLPEKALRHIGRNYLADRRVPDCPDHAMPGRMSAKLKELGLRIRRGGVPDRAAAARAGVAAIGRNGFALVPRHGSWINIETWLVDADLPPGTPLPNPCPEGCDACRKACPTDAIEAPYVMRMDRCVAWLTYGAPEPVAPELWQRMGAWIYGCDVCQNACPLNRECPEPGKPAPWIERAAGLLTPEALAAMDGDTYRARIHPLFGYIPNTDDGLERWRRNARRALEGTRRIGCRPPQGA